METSGTCKPVLYPKFIPGDLAISKEPVYFVDGTKHIIGQRLRVTEATVHYYNCYAPFYDKEVG